MKRQLILEILRKLKEKPHLMRKVKIFAIVGIVGFLITGALAIWAGISAVSYVATKANQVIQSPQGAAQVAALKSEVTGISGLQPLGCWNKAQSLMAFEPWLARPVLANLQSLKVACFIVAAPVCEGSKCTDTKDLTQTTEGDTI